MKGKSEHESSWISFSDLMTALMVIFMFIAISYILEVKKEQEVIKLILDEYENTKSNIYDDLKKEFNNDFEKWKVELDNDLSIKFTNPDILFAKGSYNLTDSFQSVLNDFLPRYFSILLSEKYIENILEIRIEGHTDTDPAPRFDLDPYIANIKLSQLRSTEVLKYFRNTSYFNSLSENHKSKLLFMLTANGLSFGRMIDSSKQLIKFSGCTPVENLSRRVEFKIVTNTEDAVDRVIEQLKSR